MLYEKKINFAKYLLISFLPYLVGMSLEQSLDAFIAYLIIYTCIVINHIMLLTGVNMLVNAAQGYDRVIIVSLFIGKMVILFLGISVGVHFIGNKVIIPVIFYIIQIFVLVFSLKRL